VGTAQVEVSNEFHETNDVMKGSNAIRPTDQRFSSGPGITDRVEGSNPAGHTPGFVGTAQVEVSNEFHETNDVMKGSNAIRPTDQSLSFRRSSGFTFGQGGDSRGDDDQGQGAAPGPSSLWIGLGIGLGLLLLAAVALILMFVFRKKRTTVDEHVSEPEAGPEVVDTTAELALSDHFIDYINPIELSGHGASSGEGEFDNDVDEGANLQGRNR
jgi:hypothetical protein